MLPGRTVYSTDRIAADLGLYFVNKFTLECVRMHPRAIRLLRVGSWIFMKLNYLVQYAIWHT